MRRYRPFYCEKHQSTSTGNFCTACVLERENGKKEPKNERLPDLLPIRIRGRIKP